MSAHTSPVAVFRADASIEIGGGHVVRSLVLADTLAERGWRCLFATAPATTSVVPALAQSGHELIELPKLSGGDEANAIGEGVRGHADWLVVDHYERDATFHHACRPWARRILVLDDLADRDHDCDLLHDPLPGRIPEDYAGRVPARCRMLLGPSYAPLRPAFAAARNAALERRQRIATPERVLIGFGTVDASNLTARALEGLRLAGYTGHADVVLGAAAPHLRAVAASIDVLPFSIALHTSTPDMAALMTAADLAIGGGGMTAWERCCLGLPAIVAVAAGNQRMSTETLNRLGAAAIIGETAEPTGKTVASAFAALSTAPRRLRSMAQAAAAICDGRGAVRVGQVMEVA